MPFKKINQWRKPYWDGVPFEYIEKVFQSSKAHDEQLIYCLQKAVRVMLYQVHIWGKKGKIDLHIYHNVVKKLRQKYHKVYQIFIHPVNKVVMKSTFNIY